MTEMTSSEAIVLNLPQTLPAGQVVATGINEADYMTHYAETHHEWVEGVVIKMAPVLFVHDQTVQYLRTLLNTYKAQAKLEAVILGDPFVMRLPKSNREPDIQVVLGDNRANIRGTYTDGPADICIEVVSPGSVAIDYGDKLAEYEAGGVTEYWIIDPARRRTTFNRLTEESLYQQVNPNTDDNYTTPLLPGFLLHVAALWRSNLPDAVEIWGMVEAMLPSGTTSK